ncbi:hypothetical protein JRQ81_011042 [Phrynocephalus forsythii]|uniref:Poly [ADP-ribose] polymerase n=1 Tax=Phrynocephalus forsythii TaxID=171643 RepID=A0A9Q0Y3A7_9SAUR|nr:hypothetical protein JRQ81_011042 [Phrynocephalus forsythii]
MAARPPDEPRGAGASAGPGSGSGSGSRMAAAAAAVEVRGVPLDVADELLVLYFENRRRSGGGPVLSCRRAGGRAVLTFESPQDAQGVLSRATHLLQEARLDVQPAAPRDDGKVVLRGLSPLTSRDLLELYVERLLDCERGDYSLYRSPAGDRALVQLPQPLSQAGEGSAPLSLPPLHGDGTPEGWEEWGSVHVRLRRHVHSFWPWQSACGRGLEGASLVLDWVERPDSLLVQSHGTARLDPDLLELYFESRRSGGGPVQAVRLLRGGTMAVVSFQDQEAPFISQPVAVPPPSCHSGAALGNGGKWGSRDPGKCPLAGMESHSPSVQPRRELTKAAQADLVVIHPQGPPWSQEGPSVWAPVPRRSQQLLPYRRSPAGPKERITLWWIKWCRGPTSFKEATWMSLLTMTSWSPLRRDKDEAEKAAAAAVVSMAEEPLAPDGGIPLSSLRLPEEAMRELLRSDLVLQELGAPVPECSLCLEGAQLRIVGGDLARRQQLQQHVWEALVATVQEHLPFSAWVLGFLQREDVQGRLAQHLAQERVAACCVPTAGEVLVLALTPSSARLATSLLGSFLGSFTLALSEQRLLALASPHWAQAESGLQCCQVRLAESGDQLEGLTLAGLEQENLAHLEAFLQDSAPDETLVTTEAGPLHYLQLHHQELLASLSDIVLLPLEEPDVTGLRLSGEAQACRAAAELLQSLLGAIHTETVTLQLPGIHRFLLEECGRAIVRDLERRFRCVIGLERLHWFPPETQHELERSQEPLALGCRREDLPGGAAQVPREASLEEVKGLLAALHPNKVAAVAAAAAAAGEEEEEEEEERRREDLYTDPEQVPVGAVPAEEGKQRQRQEEEEEEEEEEAGSLVLEAPEEGAVAVLQPVFPSGSEGSAEDDAQLLLAIQESMDSARQEEEALRQATELSLCSWAREQQSPSPDSALQSALSLSRELLDVAPLVLCAGSEMDVARVAQELEAALRAQLREERVVHAALRALPALCLDYLAYLEQKHAVRILLEDTTATVQGFADYPVAATRDLALLLSRLLRAEGPGSCGNACWVRWEPSGHGSPTSYPAETSALLEQAWRQGHKRVDVFFGGHPFIIDLEHMEEHDLGCARTLPIGRTDPPPVAGPPAPPGPLALAEDKGQLVPLSEASEEFRQTVRHFYETLGDLHNKIRIVQVEKVVHPLLCQQYQLKKAAMEKACGHQQVERLLYHGTTEESSREICQHGFNRSFCGKNGTRYGHGVYFATNASLSAQEQYSPTSHRSGNKYIFVTQTLVGDYTAGSQSMRAPPLREGDAGLRRYDSTVDNPHHPSLFVIFNDTQAYPKYLITCRWSKPR